MKPIRFKDVSGRSKPCFILSYELVENLKSTPFQGMQISFAYSNSLEMSQIFCDVFPEFKVTQYGDSHIRAFQSIPKNGFADMWIYSDTNLKKHLARLKVGSKCFLFNGEKIIATCRIVDVHLTDCQLKTRNSSFHDTNRMVHDIA